MAATGVLMFQDPAVTTVGQARGWKVGFGFTAKGTVVSVYVVAANGATTTNVREVPLLANGKADVTSVTNFLATFGVTLTNAVKQVIGA
jgi:hypothetical protein